MVRERERDNKCAEELQTLSAAGKLFDGRTDKEVSKSRFAPKTEIYSFIYIYIHMDNT